MSVETVWSNQRAQLLARQAITEAELAESWLQTHNELKRFLAAEASNPTASARWREQIIVRSMGEIRARLDDLVQRNGTLVTQAAIAEIETGQGSSLDLIDAQLSEQARMSAVLHRVPNGAMLEMALRTTQQITSRLAPLGDEVYAQVLQALRGGLAAGQAPDVIARNMTLLAEAPMLGGMARALTIARTEVIDAHRNAAMASHLANSDVLVGWTWWAALSGSTCMVCVGMHGTRHALDEPGPQGHPRCRCARIPDVDPKLSLEKTQVETGNDWLRKQPESVQLDILGPARYDWWTAGKKRHLTDMIALTPNPGWRPSYGALSLDRLGSRSAALASSINWAARQTSLSTLTHGAKLAPHEVRFLERFEALGHRADWIPVDSKGFKPTNDFHWLDHDAIEVELKSPELPHLDRIVKAIKEDARKGKTHFMIDLGDNPLSSSLRTALSQYHQRGNRPITTLWVMSDDGASLEQIHLI